LISCMKTIMCTPYVLVSFLINGENNELPSKWYRIDIAAYRRTLQESFLMGF
jgi:hypothetical protein